MSFDDEMNDIENTETTGKYIQDACVEIVTLKGYAISPADYKGVPYVDFTFETTNEDKAVNTSRFFRVKPDDSPDVAGYKRKKLKELLENAAADFTLKGEAVIKSAIGLTVKALFKKVEYGGVDGNLNNKPIIKTKIEYSFSAKSEDAIKGNQSYLYTPLNAKSLAKFNADMAKWERDNPQAQSTAQPVDGAENPSPVEANPAAPVDDLPF